jgi:hypothetical protein
VGRDGGDLEVIWVRWQAKNSGKQKYFLQAGLTGQISLIGLNKFDFTRIRQAAESVERSPSG